MARAKKEYVYDIFGERYALPRIDSGNETKEQIILNATTFFARKGYAAVSMRDIAEAIGIKPASLYNYFSGKDALWKAVLEHTKTLYLLYFDHLESELDKAESFAEAVDIIFREPIRLSNVFTCYAFCMIQSEQFRDAAAGRIFGDVMLKYSIEFIRRCFDGCVARGLVDAFDTATTATLIMHSVLICLDVKVQESLGRIPPYDPSRVMSDIKRFILRAIDRKS